MKLVDIYLNLDGKKINKSLTRYIINKEIRRKDDKGTYYFIVNDKTNWRKQVHNKYGKI